MTTDDPASAPQAPRLMLHIDVTELSDEARRDFAEKAKELLAGYQESLDESDEKVVLGWTAVTLKQALDTLASGTGSVQAEVIKKALNQSGKISREEVKAIGNFVDDRTLNGFTRTTNLLVKKMKVAGTVPAHAVALLTRATPGRALSFAVPSELKEIL
jgi:hypothetical protein